jgi:hypothetical protein
MHQSLEWESRKTKVKRRELISEYTENNRSPQAPNSKTLAMTRRLSTETVKGSALSLQSVDDIEGGDSLPLGVFGVGDRVSDDVLEEDL